MHLTTSAAAVGALSIVGVLSILSGCAPTSDPAKGGFVDGLHNLISGGYEQRVSDQSAALERAQEQRAEAEVQAKQTSAAVADRQQALAGLQGDVARIDVSLKDAEARLDQKRAETAALSEKKRHLTSQLNRLKARQSSLKKQLASMAAEDAEYNSAKQQVESLQNAIAALNLQISE